ncbi:hypothetical protein [Streptomyces sp. NPDC056194]|uniref:hypothetical protein n=1 Tax=unclassified Streptomyces TaxID=2593676 RepID=UPI0035D5D93E
MTTHSRSFPLVEERVLAPAPRTGRHFWNRPTRSHDELPRVSAHQVLVYRTGDQYITDHGIRGPEDETVLNAGSVTVVDCRTAVPVTVGTQVPSAETDGFTVQVAFHCTVTDPVAVVREGVTDVESRLLGYLRALPGLTDVTQEWPLDAGKEVSRRLSARLISYLEMEPPRIAGLSVGDPYLEVLTPEEFADQRRRADEERRAHEQDRVKEAVLRERARMEHEREQERERLASERKAMELRYEQQLEDLRRSHTQRTDAEDQYYAHNLKRTENEFERTEALKDLEDFGTDPASTDILAQRRGEISYTDLAERQREAGRLRREWQREDEQRHREFGEQRRLAEREDLRYSLDRQDRHQEVDRQDRREALEAAREDRREQWAADRDDRLRERAERREDELADRAERRHRADQRDRVNRELGAQMIQRGLLDNSPLDARAFFEGLGPGEGVLGQEAPAGEVPGAAPAPQLERGAGSGRARGEAPRPGEGTSYGDGAAYDRDRRDEPYEAGGGYGDPYDRIDGRGGDREDDASAKHVLEADDDLGDDVREERRGR